ncbi:MAG: mechanosensitive ion channel family protein, partial [Bacteroidota bacterium]
MLSSDLLDQGYVLALEYGLNLLKAILVLVVGLWAVRISTKLLVTVLDRSEVDDSLKGFLRSLVSILLKIMVYITALGMLGVEMTSFIAILGAAGLAIGMALSGTLQNFAGGV